MNCSFRNLSFLILAASAFVCFENACNSTDNERFREQRESYLFEATTSTLTAFGASRIQDDGIFRCPAVSGMSSESSLTVFKARANALLPHFTLNTIANIRSDSPGGFGISLADLPIGLLDVYQRCNSTSFEKLTTSCPVDYNIVDACSSASGAKECVLIYEGTHQLVVSAHINGEKNCFSEESDRSPYSNAPEVSWACDAYSPIVLPAAYRGSQPSNNCCSEDDKSTLDFCLKPCGCRELAVQIVPKSELLNQNPAEPTAENSALSDELRIAVFSNVEGHTGRFKKLLESINEYEANVAVSLGSLTESGRASQFIEMRNMIDDAFSVYDGMSSANSCSRADGQICCESDAERVFPNRCNAVLYKTAFLAGLGEKEADSSALDVYRELFGPSNTSTTFGKVQLVLLDTADSTLVSAQRDWLKSVLKTPEKSQCQIRPPKDYNFSEWPSLHECRNILNISDSSTKKVTCRECLGDEAWCVPPDASRSDASLGPENCICIPLDSMYCTDNLVCDTMDGTRHDCICTRDEDCGVGGSCIDGVCKPPLRLVFSYTPIFDVYGSRNEAFNSKSEAASLLSLLIRSGVSAIFSGRALDFSHYSKGGIDMYITGGGGAEMSSFSKADHHWLLVTIPNAYTNPDYNNVTVDVIEF